MLAHSGSGLSARLIFPVAVSRVLSYAFGQMVVCFDRNSVLTIRLGRIHLLSLLREMNRTYPDTVYVHRPW
jgi:hypothetical protein